MTTQPLAGGPIRIAIAGVGKIARDQHIPTIARDPRFELAAVVSQHRQDVGVPCFASIEAMMAAVPSVRALSVCTPPIGRLELVRAAFGAGLDVLIEKPPAATLSEAVALGASKPDERVLFGAWHSRFAAGVSAARAWLADRTIVSIDISWKEDVRVWHPGQDWIWEPGIGVLDPGVNALSILTEIMSAAILLDRAELHLPAGRAAPIAATLDLTLDGKVPVRAAFDFDHRGAPGWTMSVATPSGDLRLADGGARLLIDGREQPLPDTTEYAGVYDRFAQLVTARASEFDLTPFRLVADAFMLGRQREAAAFSWSD